MHKRRTVTGEGESLPDNGTKGIVFPVKVSTKTKRHIPDDALPRGTRGKQPRGKRNTPMATPKKGGEFS